MCSTTVHGAGEILKKSVHEVWAQRLQDRILNPLKTPSYLRVVEPDFVAVGVTHHKGAISPPLRGERISSFDASFLDLIVVPVHI